MLLTTAGSSKSRVVKVPIGSACGCGDQTRLRVSYLTFESRVISDEDGRVASTSMRLTIGMTVIDEPKEELEEVGSDSEADDAGAVTSAFFLEARVIERAEVSRITLLATFRAKLSSAVVVAFWDAMAADLGG